jgi:hypothetical protein
MQIIFDHNMQVKFEIGYYSFYDSRVMSLFWQMAPVT